MMYHARRTRFVSGILAVLVLAITLAQLDSNVAATNTSLPFDLQKSMQLHVQNPAMKVNGQIAFSSDRNGFLDIYVMNADGSNQRQLTFGAVNPADGFSRTYSEKPLWSPDGSKIAFKSDLDYHGLNLYLMNADGTRIRKITNSGSVCSATWAPDGN